MEIMYKQARADITEGRVFATRKELALLDDVRLSEGPMPVRLLTLRSLVVVSHTPYVVFGLGASSSGIWAD